MGITPQAVRSLKQGGIGARSIKKLAEALNVDEVKLLAVDIPERLPRPIPVISWVHAGLYAEAVDLWPIGISGEEVVVYATKTVSGHAFGLEVIGDSMSPRYLPGDIIIVDPEIRCDNGAPCVVWLNGEVSFKRFWETETEIRLQPTNDRYPIQIINKSSPADFRIIGKVVDMVAKL